MLAKKPSSLVQPGSPPVAASVSNSDGRVRTGGAIDHIAAGAGAMIAGLGAAQLLIPIIVAPLTGIGTGTAAQILGVQWIMLGGLLALGGLVRTRVVTIFAGEFIIVSAMAALAVALLGNHSLTAFLVYGAMGVCGLACSGLARITDKAELNRELHLLRERARNQGD